MPLICWFDHFLYSRAEICLIFRWFFFNLRLSKRRSEINWPLEFANWMEETDFFSLFVWFLKGFKMLKMRRKNVSYVSKLEEVNWEKKIARSKPLFLWHEITFWKHVQIGYEITGFLNVNQTLRTKIAKIHWLLNYFKRKTFWIFFFKP